MRSKRLSGNQVVICVLAACAALVTAPVGVYAVTSEKVRIADATTDQRVARVGADGALKIGGAVDTTPGVVKLPFHREVLLTQDNALLPVGPKFAEGKRIAITSITAITGVGDAGINHLRFFKTTAEGQCPTDDSAPLSAVTRFLLEASPVNGQAEFHQTYPFPIVRPAVDTALCLMMTVRVPMLLIVDGFTY